MLLLQPAWVVLDLVELGRWHVDGVEAPERVEERRLAGLVLADEYGGLVVDHDLAGVDEVAVAPHPDETSWTLAVAITKYS